ncbi:response regulator [Oxalobacteraceae bacterium CAVE-383]|nr:response regulator [Oxalobacteraceae bacterium CAVE-383]
MPSMTIQQKKARKKLVEWIFFTAISSIVAAFLILAYIGEIDRVEDAERERLQVLSNVIVNDISVNLAATNNALDGVIEESFSPSVAHKSSPAEMSRRLKALALAMPGVRSMVVLNAEGTALATTRAELLDKNFSHRIYFTTTRDHPDPSMLYISPPFLSQQNESIMAVAKMITGPDGRFGGVAVAFLDPEYFKGMFKSVMYASDVWGMVVHGDGGALLNYPPQKAASDINLDRPGTFFKRHRDSGRSTSILTGNVYTTGEPRLMAISTIDIQSLHMDKAIVVGLSRNLIAITAPTRKQLRNYGFFYLVLLAISGLWLYRIQAKRGEIESMNAIKESETRFRTLIEDAPIAIAILRKGHFIYTNPRYRRLHGYAPEDDLNGRPWNAMLAPESLVQLKHIEKLIEQDSPDEQMFEALGLGKNGGLVPVFKTTANVLLADGPATLIFTQDISAQKEAEFDMLKARDAAEAASKSKAEFLANMSHEIRSPLNAILGLAHILEQTCSDPDTADMIRKIRGSGRTLLGIINDILDVSKIEAGQMAIEHAPFRISDVIDNLASAMGIAAADKNIELIINALPPYVNNVLGDALRLEQVLVNLTSNAIKFTHAGRVVLRIDLIAKSDNAVALRFAVQDTGIGIEPAMQSAMFTPFTQADSSTTRRFGGTGLGLAICRQLVTLMGGEIGMNSVFGEGSEFYFTLTFKITGNDDFSSPGMLRIDALIADDSAVALDALSAIAQGMGWSVATVDSGEAAMQHIVSKPAGARPNVVILDWKMTGIDGIETARRIRKNVAEEECPIVIMASAFSMTNLACQPGAELVDAILNKPVTASNLYNAVIQAQRRRTASQGALEEMAGKSPARTLEGARLLVVDDSEINREVAKRILENQGAAVVTADNGQQAVDWLLEHPKDVDLVLMDVQMPVMDGIEATRRLRKMPQFNGLPIVALTAGAFKSQQDTALAAGMSHFVSKPFDVPSTVALIQRIRRRPHATILLQPTVSDPPADTDTDADGDADGDPNARTAAELPVLDIAKGLELWSDDKLYKDYLHQFIRDFGDIADRMNARLAENDLAGAASLAHKLSGVAGNLALFDAQRLAREAERILSMGYDPTSVLSHLERALQAAVAAIDGYAPRVDHDEALQAAAKALPAAVRAELQNMLSELMQALDSDNPAPVERVLDSLPAMLSGKQLQPIWTCIRNFDFRGARMETRRLAARYDIHL